MKAALASAANDLAKLEGQERDKLAKKLKGLGYDVEFDGQVVSIAFAESKQKKVANADKPTDEPKTEQVESPAMDMPVESPAVEAVVEGEVLDERPATEVPAGDLYGQDGEVANLDNEDEDVLDDEDEIEDDEDNIPDSRDEQDDDLVASRREFFENAAEFGEDMDN